MRDFKYILERVIIGITIGLVILFLRTNVFAKEYIDISNAYNNRCFGVYFSGGTRYTTQGTSTLYDTFYHNCNFGSSVLTHDYSYLLFNINKSLMEPVPSLELNKKYNISFNVRTSFQSSGTNGQIGPNNLIQVKLSPSISGNSAYDLFLSSNTPSCDIEFLNDSFQDNLLLFHNYKVTCKEYVFNSSTLNFNNLYLYLSVDSSNNTLYPAPDLIDVSNRILFEEVVTNEDINNSITNPDISGDFSGLIPDTNEEQNLLGDLVFIPFNFFKNIVDGLTYQCSPINMGSLFGVNITFPCLTPSTFIGATVWGLFDILITSVGMIAFANRLKVIFNDFLTLGTGAFKRSFEIFGIFSE